MTEITEDITLVDVDITETSIAASSVSSTTIITTSDGQIVIADSSSTVLLTVTINQIVVSAEAATVVLVQELVGGVTDHAGLTGIGTNTHPEIDTHIAAGDLHIADLDNPHLVTFTELVDTPDDFTDDANKIAKVNNTQNGIVFSIVTISASGTFGNVQGITGPGPILINTDSGNVILSPAGSVEVTRNIEASASANFVFPAGSLATTNSSSVITVTINGHGFTEGQTISKAISPTDIGGIPAGAIIGNFVIFNVTVNTFDFDVGVNATSDDTGHASPTAGKTNLVGLGTTDTAFPNVITSVFKVTDGNQSSLSSFSYPGGFSALVGTGKGSTGRYGGTVMGTVNGVESEFDAFGAGAILTGYINSNASSVRASIGNNEYAYGTRLHAFVDVGAGATGFVYDYYGNGNTFLGAINAPAGIAYATTQGKGDLMLGRVSNTNASGDAHMMTSQIRTGQFMAGNISNTGTGFVHWDSDANGIFTQLHSDNNSSGGIQVDNNGDGCSVFGFTVARGGGYVNVYSNSNGGLLNGVFRAANGYTTTVNANSLGQIFMGRCNSTSQNSTVDLNGAASMGLGDFTNQNAYTNGSGTIIMGAGIAGTTIYNYEVNSFKINDKFHFISTTPGTPYDYMIHGANNNMYVRLNGITEQFAFAPSSVARSLPVSSASFKKGATAPTEVTIGTTPTVGALLFDAIDEIGSFKFHVPSDMDLTANFSVKISFGLTALETDSTSADGTLDFIALDPANNEVYTKVNSTTTASTTVTTANGLAADTFYDMVFTINVADGTNPVPSINGVYVFEFHLTNVTGVAAINVTEAHMEYQSTH